MKVFAIATAATKTTSEALLPSKDCTSSGELTCDVCGRSNGAIVVGHINEHQSSARACRNPYRVLRKSVVGNAEKDKYGIQRLLRSSLKQPAGP